MPCQASFAQWQTTLMPHLPPLSTPQAIVLALWSLGMVLAQSCALTAVSAMVATVQGRTETTLRQRLREWDDEAPATRGTQRQALQRVPASAAGHPVAARQHFSPRLVHARGGAAPP
jgi:hypothetical protein